MRFRRDAVKQRGSGSWNLVQVESLSLLRVSAVVSGQRRQQGKGQGRLRRCSQFTRRHGTHSSLVSDGVLCPAREKAWSKMESLSPHLVGQLLLESVQPPESVLELAAILLAGQTAHPTPWEGCIRPSRCSAGSTSHSTTHPPS